MKLTRLYPIFLLCLLFASVAYGQQFNVRDSLQTILHNDSLDVETRFKSGYNMVCSNSSPEEAEELCRTVLYPFVQENWSDKSSQLAGLSQLYISISFCYRERAGEGDDEMERVFGEKALEAAIESGKDQACALMSYANAGREIKRGKTEKAHEYLYLAIHYFDKMEMYTWSSTALYTIAGSFFDIKDTDALERVLKEMEDYLEKDNFPQSQYQYNVIKHSYYGLLLESQKKNGEPFDQEIIDLCLLYVRKNIELVENNFADLAASWMHGYAYYFLARELNDYYPERTDAILSNLDKAAEMMELEISMGRHNENNSRLELKIHMNEVRAKALLREGRMRESLAAMNEALEMLDQLHNYENLSVLRHDAYEFMVEYYEKAGQPGEALKYHKMLFDTEARRYEKEKVQAMNDMSAKYETEKKEIRIQTLTKENRTARIILTLAIGLLLLLLTTLVFVAVSGRLKRKNVEQRLYETALLAELRQNELDKMQAGNGQDAQGDPVESAVAKMARMISDSPIGKEDKKRYLDRLSRIDSGTLGQAYRTSKVKITGMDMKYIICFNADVDVRDISLIFNVEPASVRTVRYRIRKKFPKEDPFRMII